MAFCGKCGKELRPGNTFCVNCGAAIPADLNAEDTACRSNATSESTVFAQNTTENCADSFQRGMPHSDIHSEGLSLMQYFFKCYSHYADFSGKANRKELWGFALVSGLINAVLILAGVLVGNSLSPYGGLTLFILSGLYSLINVIPSLAVSVRRLHDTGRSGGWIFISLIPFIGSIWLLVLFCTEGYNETSDRPASSAFKSQLSICIVLFIMIVIAWILVYDYFDNLSIRSYNDNEAFEYEIDKNEKPLVVSTEIPGISGYSAEDAKTGNDMDSGGVIPYDASEQPNFYLGNFSSQHKDSSDGISSDSYYASNVIDNNIRTAWIPVCEDDGLTPIGHWVELNAKRPQHVNGLKIINGFAKDERKYYNNYRVKDIKIIIDDMYEISATLSDKGCGQEEYISFGRVYTTSDIRIIIESVYETSPKYKEAAISEILPALY